MFTTLYDFDFEHIPLSLDLDNAGIGEMAGDKFERGSRKFGRQQIIPIVVVIGIDDGTDQHAVFGIEELIFGLPLLHFEHIDRFESRTRESLRIRQSAYSLAEKAFRTASGNWSYKRSVSVIRQSPPAVNQACMSVFPSLKSAIRYPLRPVHSTSEALGYIPPKVSATASGTGTVRSSSSSQPVVSPNEATATSKNRYFFIFILVSFFNFTSGLNPAIIELKIEPNFEKNLK